jgi:hypothetical protein
MRDAFRRGNPVGVPIFGGGMLGDGSRSVFDADSESAFSSGGGFQTKLCFL